MKFKKDFQSIKDTFRKENDKDEDLRKILQDLEKYKTKKYNKKLWFTGL